MEKGSVVFFARVVPSCNLYDVRELIIRTVEDDHYVGYDTKTAQAFLFSDSDIERTIFFTRSDALSYVNSVRDEVDGW